MQFASFARTRQKFTHINRLPRMRRQNAAIIALPSVSVRFVLKKSKVKLGYIMVRSKAYTCKPVEHQHATFCKVVSHTKSQPKLLIISYELISVSIL